MKREVIHLSDRDLIMKSDGELSPWRRKIVEEHLQSCWMCRERMVSLEETINEFVRARNCDLDERIQDSGGPRALLRVRLREVAAEPSNPGRLGSLVASLHTWRLSLASAVFVAAILVILVTFEANVTAEGPKPRSSVTPGEVRPITLAEVCEYDKAEVVSRDIPEDKQKEVFRTYGIHNPRAGQYEVDYLITPDLGGTESIRNLWPQPYSARWNARVKDRLEERLHELVCSRKIDLATAQHDIAVDWISAYKKYLGEETNP